MPNPMYLKGVRKERQFVNEARDKGCIAFRSAGSHSPIDVIIIHPSAKIIELIQCKPDEFSEKEKEKLERKYAELTGDFRAYFYVR